MTQINGVSVVIPNYNGAHLFPHTLPGIFAALTNLAYPYEVLVVDDASQDDSITFLQKDFPQVKIITNKTNSGFSVTANNGIRNAVYDLVLLLNSDVKLEPDYFQNQLRYFELTDTFGVMGRIVGWTDDHIQDGAKYPSFHNAKIKTSVNYLLGEDEMHEGLYTMYLSGANALMHREKFLALGGFNELFSPFYVEDYELSVRAWRHGWKCYYDYRSLCRHQTSTSIRSKSRKHFIKLVSNRNKWYVHAIHLDKGKRFMWLLQLIPEILLQTILLKFYYIQAFVQFAGNYGKVKESRKRFLNLERGHPVRSFEEVANEIRASVKDKNPVFF